MSEQSRAILSLIASCAGICLLTAGRLLAEAGRDRPGLLDVYRSCFEGGTGQFLEALGGDAVTSPRAGRTGW